MRAFFTATGSCFALVATLVAAQRQADRPSAFTEEQAAAGKIEIQKNLFGACTDCHTTALTGRKGAPGELPPIESLSESYQALIKGNNGIVPPFVGPEFVAKWGPRSTTDLIAEFEMRFAPPGSRMSQETRLDLIAYILQANGALAGNRRLTPTTNLPISLLLPN